MMQQIIRIIPKHPKLFLILKVLTALTYQPEAVRGQGPLQVEEIVPIVKVILDSTGLNAGSMQPSPLP